MWSSHVCREAASPWAAKRFSRRLLASSVCTKIAFIPAVSTGGCSPLGCCPLPGQFGPWGGYRTLFARCFLKALFIRLFCKVTFGRPFLEDPFCRVLLQGSFWKTFSARPHQPQNARSQLRPKVSSISCFSGSPRGHWVSMTLRGPALSDASASLEAPGSPWLPPPEPICFHRASRFGLGDYFAFSFPCTP